MDATIRSTRPALLLLVLAALLVPAPVGAEAVAAGAFSGARPGGALPKGWQPLRFARIERPSDYALVDVDGVVVVRAESRGGASGLTRSLDLDPATYPVVEWRWRIANLLAGSDVTRKSGDDHPARLYVAFAFDPRQAGWLERMRYEALRLVYGEYPPKAAINYIWASHSPKGTVVPNPYSDRTWMVVVESGDEHLGEWRRERRDVAADYQRIFGEPAPRVSGVGIMTDTDDTGESAVAWFGDIVFRERAGDATPGPGAGSPG